MNFLRDLKYAVRSLSRVPALWITVALTLALGIGANAAIFSVVRAVLLKPLANQDESRLLYIRQSAPGLEMENANFSVPEIQDISTGLKTISEIGTFSQVDFTIVGLGTPRTVTAGVVDGNYFHVMGLRPVLGRLLGPADDGRNAPGAIVLTYNFWRESLHGDPNVLGKVVRIEVYNGPTSGVVVGVLEPSVPYPVATQIFANLVTSPHHLSATMVTGRSHRMTEVFGRLAPGATLEQARPPFDSSRVMAIDLPVMAYGRTPEQVTEFRREVVRNVAAIPGVEHAAEGFAVPWRDPRNLGIVMNFAASGARRADGQDYHAKFRPVGPGFFDTLGVPLLTGRDFNLGDKQGAERVVIISKSLADLLYPGQNALNRTITWTDPVIKFIGISAEPRRIVAVVPDFDDENIIPAPAMTIYQPTEQEGFPGSLFVRAKQDPYTLLPVITQTIRKMSNDQPVEKPTTLDDVRAEVLSPDKLNAIVFGGFAAVALLISVVGVAGVLAFSVSSRTKEFGIRMALGAQPATILAGVLRDGLWMAGIGVTAGIVLGFVLSRVVASKVAVIDQPGVLAFAGAAGVILAAAVVASAIPAMRAARVNAAEALRAE